jgi:tetratricopeptide (TPR) repeat protein
MAYAMIALACIELGETGHDPAHTAFVRARQAANKALTIDPDLSESYSALAALDMLAFNWPEAERLFKRALELSPSNADAWDMYGRMCAALERHEEAIAMQRRAYMLDPLAHRSDLANALLRAGRYEEAVVAAEEGLRADPNYDRAHATLGWAYLKTGRTAEGIAQLEKAVAITPEATTWTSQLGQAYAITGRTDDARAMLNHLLERYQTSYISPYHLAYIYTGLGDYDKAMDLLDEAFEEKSGALYGLKSSFLFQDLHPHPRFQALMRKMNLA